MPAAIPVAAAIGGALISADATRSAANKQADAAKGAQQIDWQKFQQMQSNLQPYMNLGAQSIPQLQQLLGSSQLNPQFSFNPTQDQLEQTPGYQFTLQQGLKGLNNQMSGRGLIGSGAQQKAMADYTTGLADKTFQQQYQNALQNFSTNYGVASDKYNRLASLLGMGQNAAAGVGNAGLQTANNVANLMTGAGNAQAAGQIGSANAFSGALSNIGNYAMLQSLLGSGANSGSITPQALSFGSQS